MAYLSRKFDIEAEQHDTLGKRLRYFREAEIGESREKFVQGLDITPRTLERYESDEFVPDASFFTRLNSKHHKTINLDWLLTGRGNLYIAEEAKAETAKESPAPFYDVILEKMHEQLDRIYKERDFLKLASLQSLLNLIDPEKEK